MAKHLREGNEANKAGVELHRQDCETNLGAWCLRLSQPMFNGKVTMAFDERNDETDRFAGNRAHLGDV